MRTFVAAVAFLVVLVVLLVATSRVRNLRVLKVFGKQGSLDESWIEHEKANLLDRLAGLPGKPFSVTLRGDDPAIAEQIKAIQGLQDLRVIIFDSVEVSDLPDGEFRLPDVDKLSFSNCEGDAVQVLLTAASDLRVIRIYDSEELSDKALDGARFLSEVKIVELDGTNVSGTFLKNYHIAKKLSSVTMRYCPVSAEALHYLGRFPAVKHIEIDSPTSDISYDRAEAILESRKPTVDILLGGFRVIGENEEKVSERGKGVRRDLMGQVSLMEMPRPAPERRDIKTVAERLPFFVGGQDVRHLCGTKPPRRWFSSRRTRSASGLFFAHVPREYDVATCVDKQASSAVPYPAFKHLLRQPIATNGHRH